MQGVGIFTEITVQDVIFIPTGHSSLLISPAVVTHWSLTNIDIALDRKHGSAWLESQVELQLFIYVLHVIRHQPTSTGPSAVYPDPPYKRISPTKFNRDKAFAKVKNNNFATNNLETMIHSSG